MHVTILVQTGKTLGQIWYLLVGVMGAIHEDELAKSLNISCMCLVVTEITPVSIKFVSSTVITALGSRSMSSSSNRAAAEAASVVVEKVLHIPLGHILVPFQEHVVDRVRSSSVPSHIVGAFEIHGILDAAGNRIRAVHDWSNRTVVPLLAHLHRKGPPAVVAQEILHAKLELAVQLMRRNGRRRLPGGFFRTRG
jgi:hypothetical protein